MPTARMLGIDRNMIIVSLSTIPPRFGILGKTLRSLLNQSIKIDEIRVNIPKKYRRFPEHEFSVPEVPDGVTLCVNEEDYGPSSKLLPTLAEFKGREDVSIIYCDDDRVAHPDWAKRLIDTSIERPNECIANAGWGLDSIGFEITGLPQPRCVPLSSRRDLVYRWRRIKQQTRQILLRRQLPKPPRHRNCKVDGYIDIAEGCGGVLVRPNFFDDRVFNVPQKLWSVDDIWLSGMMAAKNTRVWKYKTGLVPSEQDDARDSALYLQVIEGYNRQQANAACVRLLQREFGVWN